MHDPGYTPTNNFVQVHFSESFVPFTEQPKLADLIQSKIDNREYFYGIELSAKTNSTLDYRKFTLLPLFTSLIWIGGQYCDVEPIADVDAIRFGNYLSPWTVVMPHFTCYRATSERLKNFLSMGFANVLALRGDDVDEKQEYQHASDLVTAIRKTRGDTITIAVGGYPEGHPESKSMDEDMQYLIKKVSSGADFIITQLCFNTTSIIEFIGNCRKNGIKVPIIVGVYVPENYYIFRRILKVTRVVVPADQMLEYKKRKDNETEFKTYAIEVARQLITDVFESDTGVYGIQFFSLNRFGSVEVLANDLIAKFNTMK